MEDDESGRQPSFKVQDRRRFAATGEARTDVPEERADAGSQEPPPRIADEDAHEHDAHATHQHADHAAPELGGGEITFASFVFSLSTQALVHLGEIPDPADDTTRVNLDGARQIIDILSILHEKTVGNLDAAESALLENALYDLRMRYVDRARHR
jgi:hypothetical protein